MNFTSSMARRAALTVMTVACFGGSGLVAGQVPALVGGGTIAGNQATVALDPSVPGALSIERVAGVTTATAYFNWHVFCSDIAGTPGANTIRVRPRYQLPSPALDVWRFPNVEVTTLTHGSSTESGAPIVRIGAEAASPRQRCLSALPGSSLEPWSVNRGLFQEGFGDYIGANNGALGTPPAQTPPSGPHQNVKVTAQQFPGLVAGKEVAVVRVETQFDSTTPTAVSWGIYDAYNASALGSEATWCLLTPTWTDGTTPPANLCANSAILFPGTSQNVTPIVSQGLGFFPTFPGPFYILVSRDTVGSASAGSAKQGFAALRIDGGLSGVADELQDWYPNDSVWYTY